MGADTPPDRFEKPQGFYVNLQCKDVAQAERVHQAAEKPYKYRSKRLFGRLGGRCLPILHRRGYANDLVLLG
jgi:hypothetical protein